MGCPFCSHAQMRGTVRTHSARQCPTAIPPRHFPKCSLQECRKNVARLDLRSNGKLGFGSNRDAFDSSVHPPASSELMKANGSLDCSSTSADGKSTLMGRV